MVECRNFSELFSRFTLYLTYLMWRLGKEKKGRLKKPEEAYENRKGILVDENGYKKSGWYRI